MSTDRGRSEVPFPHWRRRWSGPGRLSVAGRHIYQNTCLSDNESGGNQSSNNEILDNKMVKKMDKKIGKKMVRSKRKTLTPPPTAAPAATQATEDLRRQILEYLQSHNAMTIASCRRDVPWAAAVFYASDGFDLYFLSDPSSRHGTNMAANKLVSATIHEDPRDWRAIRGIQLEGRAEQVRSPERKVRFWEIYLKKFPFVEEFFRPGPEREMLQEKLAGIRLYRIVPRAVWYLDNSRGFGHREQLTLPPNDVRS